MADSPLPGATADAIAARLTAHGWDPEYTTDSEVKVTFPDPEHGHAMRFSEFWLSWQLIDGRLAYGISDDIGGPWRARLGVEPDARPEAVADAADRAMHLLWHCDQRDALSKLHADYSLLSAMEVRMQELGRRVVVTPRMIREALKPSGGWTP
ncbi:hypothetical protein [Streptomyces griseoluteus]|uniref:hypothetical protein n=1 Tax=Streptomyces griseoluteus TaxID=29306 RepID=UPI00365C04AA